MYDLVAYGSMIADVGRTSSYARALEANIRPGSVVLDIGTGSGIVALLACRAGAAKVYAVEPSDVIQVAREVAAANGFAERIEFIQAMTTDIELPNEVDGIVADLRGVLPLFQKSIVSLVDARARFLKPSGWIVPARDTLWAALVSSPSLCDSVINAWNTKYGFDLSIARAKATNEWQGRVVNSENLIVEPKCWAVLNYKTLQEINTAGEVSWTMERSAVAHGVGVWFDTETCPGIGFSNSPCSNEKHVYGQAFFPWPRATELVPGDHVRVRFRADFVHIDYHWAWETQVTGGNSGTVEAEYRQSCFAGMLLSPERLRKRANTFTPQPNEASRVDRRILELMDEKLTVGEIADKILAEFPSSFKDVYAALSRAGDLSDRYSK